MIGSSVKPMVHVYRELDDPACAGSARLQIHLHMQVLAQLAASTTDVKTEQR